MRPLDAFLTQPEQRLLALILPRPERDFGTVELLGLMGSSRGAGSALLQRWIDVGLLRERRVGNQRRLSANPKFVLFGELRAMVAKTIGMVEPLARALQPVADRLSQAFVFGSVAAGTDTDQSDIDLAVVGQVDLFDVSPLLDAVQGELGRSLHVNVYRDKEWRASRDPVLNKIKKGPRLDLMVRLRESTGRV